MNVTPRQVIAGLATALFALGAGAQPMTPEQQKLLIARMDKASQAMRSDKPLDVKVAAPIATATARIADQRALVPGQAASAPTAAAGAKPPALTGSNAQLNGNVSALPTGPAVAPQRPGVPSNVVVAAPVVRPAGPITATPVTQLPQAPLPAGTVAGAVSGNPTGGVVVPVPVRPLPGTGGRDTGTLNPGGSPSPVASTGGQQTGQPVVVPTQPVTVPVQPITVPAQPVTGGDVRPNDPGAVPHFPLPDTRPTRPGFRPATPDAATPAVDQRSADERARQVGSLRPWASDAATDFTSLMDALVDADSARAKAPIGSPPDVIAQQTDARTLQRAVDVALGRPDLGLLNIAVAKQSASSNFNTAGGGAAAFAGALEKLAAASGGDAINRALPSALAEVLALGVRPASSATIMTFLKAAVNADDLKSMIASLQVNNIDLAPLRAGPNGIDTLVSTRMSEQGWSLGEVPSALSRRAGQPMTLKAPTPRFVAGDSGRSAALTRALAVGDLTTFKELLPKVGTERFPVSTTSGTFTSGGAARGSTSAERYGLRAAHSTRLLSDVFNQQPAALQALMIGAQDHARAVARTSLPEEAKAALTSLPRNWGSFTSYAPAGDAANGERLTIWLRDGASMSANEALSLLRAPQTDSAREGLVNALKNQGGALANVAQAVRSAEGQRGQAFLNALDAALAAQK